MAVTLKDVAARAGVSRSAVSRTFTQGASVSERTRRKVEKAAHEARSKLVDMAKDLGVEADVQIRGGRPHHAVVEFADEVGADLILIGSHDPGIRDYLMGSTASGVVRHAKCSVWVVRE